MFSPCLLDKNACPCAYRHSEFPTLLFHFLDFRFLFCFVYLFSPSLYLALFSLRWLASDTYSEYDERRTPYETGHTEKGCTRSPAAPFFLCPLSTASPVAFLAAPAHVRSAEYEYGGRARRTQGTGQPCSLAIAGWAPLASCLLNRAVRKDFKENTRHAKPLALVRSIVLSVLAVVSLLSCSFFCSIFLWFWRRFVSAAWWANTLVFAR